LTTTINPTSKAVSEIADFGHVFVVGHSGGIVALSDEIDNFPGGERPSAPESLDDRTATPRPRVRRPRPGSCRLSGMTGQYGYSGPWLHDSEVIEGGRGEYVLATRAIGWPVYGSYSPEDCASCNGSARC
jgi:hypothetical protein